MHKGQKRKYITELYEDHREQMPKFEVTSGESIMKDEIQKALKINGRWKSNRYR